MRMADCGMDPNLAGIIVGALLAGAITLIGQGLQWRRDSKLRALDTARSEQQFARGRARDDSLRWKQEQLSAYVKCLNAEYRCRQLLATVRRLALAEKMSNHDSDRDEGAYLSRTTSVSVSENRHDTYSAWTTAFGDLVDAIVLAELIAPPHVHQALSALETSYWNQYMRTDTYHELAVRGPVDPTHEPLLGEDESVEARRHFLEAARRDLNVLPS